MVTRDSKGGQSSETASAGPQHALLLGMASQLESLQREANEAKVERQQILRVLGNIQKFITKVVSLLLLVVCLGLVARKSSSLCCTGATPSQNTLGFERAQITEVAKVFGCDIKKPHGI